MHTPIARFMGPTWGPSGTDRWAQWWSLLVNTTKYWISLLIFIISVNCLNAKWAQFLQTSFTMRFLLRKYLILNRISLKCHPKCLIDLRSAYDQTGARRWRGNTALVWSLRAESSGPYIGHQSSTSSLWKVALPDDLFTCWRQEMKMLVFWEGNQPVIGVFLSQLASNAEHWCFLWN